MHPTFFLDAASLHRWMLQHHDSATELLVGLYRKATGRGITYAEALDEALAFGWIDGVRRRIDAESYSIRFTPRTKGSIWSAVNLRRAGELIAQDRMRPAGLRCFEQRDPRKSKLYSYEREQAHFDPQQLAIFGANPEALAFFESQPPGYRRTATFWVTSAKQEATRARRLTHLIDCSAAGRRIDLLKPTSK